MPYMSEWEAVLDWFDDFYADRVRIGGYLAQNSYN